MDLNLWYIFASALLVTAHAITYDRGPQLFVDPASQTLSNEQKYETKEVVLYLTPSQVKVLEAGGAVVRPRTNEAQPGFRDDIPTQNEDEIQQTIDQEQAIPDIRNTDEQEQKQIKELEEIFKILNEQIEEEQRREQSGNDEVRPVVEEQDDLPEVVQEEQQEPEQANAEEEEQVPEEDQQEEEQEEEEEDQEEETEDEAQEEGQEEDEEEQTEEQQEEQDVDEEEGAETQGDEEEEEVVEIPRRVPFRFRPTSKQPEVKYPTPSPDKKEKRTRTEPVGDAKKSKLRPSQKNSKKANKKKSKGKKDANKSEKKSKTVTNERPQEEKQVQTSNVEKAQEKLTALLTPLLSSDKIVQSITQQRGKLVQSELELQSVLRKLKQAPKYNDQKFAIEVEKLKENLAKQNALSRAEVIAKTTPTLIKEDLKKQRPGQAVNRPAAYNAAYTRKASQPYTVPLHYVRPVSVPVVKSAKLEIQKPVTIEVEERVPVHVAKNVYYKLNKPYVVERIVPVGKKEVANSLPVRKPERLTILRHVWEH